MSINPRSKIFLKLLVASIIVDVVFWGYVRGSIIMRHMDGLSGAILWVVVGFFLFIITAVFFGLFVLNAFKRGSLPIENYSGKNYGAIGSGLLGIIMWGKYFGTLYDFIPPFGGIPESWFLVFGGLFLLIGLFSLLRSSFFKN